MSLIDPQNEIDQDQLINSILQKSGIGEPDDNSQKSILELLSEEGLDSKAVIRLLANFARNGTTEAIQFNATKMIVEILRKALGNDEEKIPIYQVLIVDAKAPKTEGGLNPILIPRSNNGNSLPTNNA